MPAFDLPPGGTCYPAETPLGAFVEVFREIFVLSRATIDLRVLSRLRVPDDTRLADFTLARARAYGLTAAIDSSPLYEVTQAWAESAARAGFGGVRYLVSHDPSQRYRGIALFGASGEAKSEVESTDPIGSDLIEAGFKRFRIRVLATP